MGSVNLGSNSNINADISRKPSNIQHFAEFSSGAGSTILKADNYGFFVGGTDFQSAPWAVDYEGKQYLGANGEIVLDGPNKKITVGTGGLIQTDFIKDSTYGLNGVFCYTYRSTDTTSPSVSYPTGLPTNGGLLNATLNFVGTGGNYGLLPGFNTTSVKSYYNISKSGGYYTINFYPSNIYSDVTYNTLYFTLLFNSQETNGW